MCGEATQANSPAKTPPRPGSGRHWEPGTWGPSNFHESASKSASRAPRHTPGSGIAARVDLEGSRGLESLPGALFFSRYMSKISETCHFLPGKNRRRHTTRTSNRSLQPPPGRRRPPPGIQRPPPGRKRPPPGLRPPRRPEAAGRPKSGFFQKCPGSLWGAPGAPPESPGAPGGALGAPKGPKMPPGGHGAPWGPHGPPLRCGTCAKRIVLLS